MSCPRGCSKSIRASFLPPSQVSQFGTELMLNNVDDQSKHGLRAMSNWGARTESVRKELSGRE